MPVDRNALSWTSAQVLSDVRRKASLPTTSTDWTDAVLLREASDVLYSFAGWALAQAGEGRLLASVDRPISTVLTGPYGSGNEVALPPLAIASTVEGVSWTNAEGRVETRLQRIDLADQPTYATPVGEGSPSSYALVGERIRLYPRPNSGGTLRITYQRRHPELVLDTLANAGIVQTWGAATSTTTTLGTNLTPIALGDALDIFLADYPYAPVAQSVEVTALPGGGLYTLNIPYPQLSWAPTGSRVVKAGTSPYVHLPLELRTCVAEKIAANVLRTMGDMQGMQAAEQSATMELARVMQMLSPRTKRDKVKAVNPSSLMRAGITRWRW